MRRGGKKSSGKAGRKRAAIITENSERTCAHCTVRQEIVSTELILNGQQVRPSSPYQQLCNWEFNSMGGGH